MCSGTALLYRIPKIVIGENRTFQGPEDYVRSRGIDWKSSTTPSVTSYAGLHRGTPGTVERRHRRSLRFEAICRCRQTVLGTSSFKQGCHCPIDAVCRKCHEFWIIGTPSRNTIHRSKNPFFCVTPPCSAGLENQVELSTRCSKNTRIRASWAKFQKSSSVRPPQAHATLLSNSPAVELDS